MRCKDCRYFEPLDSEYSLEHGECRRKSSYQWPVRHVEEWCGKFALGLSEEAWHFRYNMHRQG